MCDLRVRFSQSAVRRNVFNYALKVEVCSASGISRKIFVYHQMPKGCEGNSFSEFDHVATPVDLQEIPEDAASDIVPWYRTDACEVWFRNAKDMELAKRMFVDDIALLRNDYDLLNSGVNFENQTTVDFSSEGVKVV